jgi:hypothetical protein
MAFMTASFCSWDCRSCRYVDAEAEALGVVLGVGVLLDVQVLLAGPAGIEQEGPLGAHRGAGLLQGVMVVGGDGGDLGVGHRDLGVVGR